MSTSAAHVHRADRRLQAQRPKLPARFALPAQVHGLPRRRRDGHQRRDGGGPLHDDPRDGRRERQGRRGEQKVSEESKKVSEVSRMNIKDLASDSPELLAEFNKEADEHDKAIARPAAGHRRSAGRADQRQQMMSSSLVGGLALMVVLIGLLGHLLHAQGGGAHLQDEAPPQAGGRGQPARSTRGSARATSCRTSSTPSRRWSWPARDGDASSSRTSTRRIAAVESDKKSEAEASLARVREAMKGTLEG